MKKILFVSMLLAGFMSTTSHAMDYYVKEIKIEGIKRVEQETVEAYLGIKAGSTVSQDKLDTAFKNLYSTGLFTDIQIENEDDGLMVVKLEESPILGKIAFDGNKKLDDKILETEIQSMPNSLYNKAKVQQDVQRILEVYRRSGRYSVEVEPKIIKREDNRLDLIFEIDEGPTAKINKINFFGNTHYSSPDLQDEIMSKESRWYRIFSSSETYDAEKMNYDKELLRRFYTEHGYADFQVTSAIAELAPNKKSFILNFNLEEGPRYKVSNIEVKSAIKEIKIDDFLKYVTFKKDSWYNAAEIEKSVSAITDELGKKGFVFIDVVPEFRKDAENNEIKVIFKINEGERTFVNRINIFGNTRTLDEVIRREFRLDEGDPFNVAKIRDSRRNIENLNYFSKVDINPVPLDSSRADINVKVEEKSTGYFNVGIGYSTVNGALVQAGVTENNFQGKGQKLSLDASVSQRSKDYSVSFTEPYFLGRRLSAGIDIFYNDESYQDESSYDSASAGGRVRFGWNYTDNLYQTVRYTLSRDEIRNVKDYASEYIKKEEGKSTDSVIGQTIVYDKRDNAIKTKDGYFLSFGNDVSGIGGDEKYLKFDVKSYKFKTFNDYWTLIVFANGGYVTSYGDNDVRLSKRYYLGGNTLRGFEYSGVGARDMKTDDALGGNWVVYGGTELMFPLGLDELGIRGRTFFDIGMIGKPDDIESESVEYSSKPRASVGFGFEWYSPMGKIDVDFGFPILKEEYDQKEVFRLNFGTSL